jgi:hypothetical protein
MECISRPILLRDGVLARRVAGDAGASNAGMSNAMHEPNLRSESLHVFAEIRE